MNIAESIRIALGALVANKLRAILTMLGIIIGVGAVISLMSIGKGVQASVTSQIQGLGSNLIFVRPGSIRDGRVQVGGGSAQTLTYDDADAIYEGSGLGNIVAVAPEFASQVQILFGGRNWNTRVTATTPEYETVRNVTLAQGEFISRQHLESKSSVIVLGSNVATNLFGEENPIDQSIRVSIGGRTGSNFRVIGVMESKGSSAFANQDDQVLVPITTMYARLFAQRTTRGGQNVSVINIQVDDERNIEQTVQALGDLLRERHRTSQDDFTVQSQQDMLQSARQVTDVLTLFLGSVAGISLFVGGIGIMNIMLVSVTERTREIGIRKAVGAKRRDILGQFLIEAVVVALVGGGIGVALGVGISRLLENANLGGQRLQAVVSPDAVLLAFGVSAAIGLFFGIYPASRAASLNPIEALRYE